jgi:hypothetical protein
MHDDYELSTVTGAPFKSMYSISLRHQALFLLFILEVLLIQLYNTFKLKKKHQINYESQSENLYWFFFRDDILSLVYKARNHWVTHCNCDKKLFVNSIQDILR